MDTSKVKYIVAKGGGVKICAYTGAIKALEEKGIKQRVLGWAGTSAGAIIATLGALEYSATEIESIVLGYDFKKFLDKSFLSKITAPYDYGYCNGDYFMKAIKKAIKDKTGSENITFNELKRLGYPDLKVYATAVDLEDVSVEFSYEKSPAVKVCEAVRASMSIPGIYKAATINGGKQLYFDGGLVLNYPINAFDEVAKDGEVLGLYLHNFKKDYRKEPENRLKHGEPFEFMLKTFKSSLDAQEVNTLGNKEIMSKTILIDTLGMSSTNFDINNIEKKQLSDSGYKSTISYL